MKFSAFTSDALEQKGDCLVLPAFSEGQAEPVFDQADQALSGALTARIKAGDYQAEAGKTFWLYPEGFAFSRVVVLGLGKRQDYSLAVARKALRSLASTLKSSAAKTAVISLPAAADTAEDSRALTEALVLALHGATYEFNAYKSGKSDSKKISLSNIKLGLSNVALKQAREWVKQARAMAIGVELAKDLGNQPGNVCTPTFLTKQAKKLAKDHNLELETLGEKEMKKLGMNTFLSVSKGSTEEGQLIILQYKGGKSSDKSHVLVGKGITFDTGGISLKPGLNMDEMKYDMCGAASVLGTLLAIAEMKAPINVIGLVAAAENMPAGNASKPGDIVKSLSGQTVEILNTDAEGRLVLCDTLTYAKRFEPASIVDIATLTGACIVALGHHTSGMLANNDELAKELLDAGQQSGDRCWQLPLWPEYNEQLNSNFADMQNIGPGGAGTITAACFLSRFTEDMNWAHLDIAGTAWVSGKDKGATGRPVPLLTRYLLNKLNAG